ncbi:MAG: hypothetical protein ANABAC_2535 [Anaerolineae bacterium]|nr:MAG: hypothetical protein ANABAC_2535 [Anaerolineae bacterium]
MSGFSPLVAAFAILDQSPTLSGFANFNTQIVLGLAFKG